MPEVENLPAVVEAQPTMLPVVSSEMAREAMSAYQRLCESILTKDDYQVYGGGKKFKKKSAFKKLARFYQLTVEEIPDSQGRFNADWSKVENDYIVEITYRATAPSGQSATGDGACQASEKGSQGKLAPYQTVRGTAHTRAANRAISNLVAMGEVSAEEMPRERKTEFKATPEQKIKLQSLIDMIDLEDAEAVKAVDKVKGNLNTMTSERADKAIAWFEERASA